MKDISGIRFGSLVAQYPIKTKREIYWHCICDCGNSKDVRGTSLRYGATKTCGCSWKSEKNRKLSSERKLLNPLVRTARFFISKTSRGAYRRGYEFSLTESQVIELIFLPCAFCGFLPTGSFITGHGTQTILKHNGLDRLDNSIGYIYSNCVPCCKECNFKKSQVSVEIMIKSLEFLGYEIIKK